MNPFLRPKFWHQTISSQRRRRFLRTGALNQVCPLVDPHIQFSLDLWQRADITDFSPLSTSFQNLSDPEAEGNRSVSFLDQPITIPTQSESTSCINETIDELFGTYEKSSPDSPWTPALFNFAQNIVCSGLTEDRRSKLLKQYEAKDTLAILGPPKLNKLLIPALKSSASVIKRDEYQSISQAQVAASLNAFGLAISFLVSPEIKQLLPDEASLAFRQLADGFHLLSDHQHRLSLARRAFIKPSLSLVGKNAVDNAPVDEWLFGSSFAEGLKDAQACEKAARDLLRSTPNIAKPNA